MDNKLFGRENIVWMDMEMTGLDVQESHILEVACLVTDSQLSIVAEGPDLIIHHSDTILNSMNDWCKENHGKSGLTEACRSSTLSLQKAEQLLFDFLKKHVPRGKCPLAGNTVYMDRMFLQSYMPSVNDYLHYRIIDVSTIKELCRRWYPDKFRQCPSKVLRHRALDDIKESIQELQYYRSAIFQSDGSQLS